MPVISHQIRLEPTVRQAQFLSRCAGTSRFTWNWALAESKRIYAETGKSAKLNDRFFPSSKTCSSCGVINESLTLSERTWVCMSCGTEHDRDLNAAKNLRTLGLRETPGAVPETLVDRMASTPRKSRAASRLVEARSTTRSKANTCDHNV